MFEVFLISTVVLSYGFYIFFHTNHLQTGVKDLLVKKTNKGWNVNSNGGGKNTTLKSLLWFSNFIRAIVQGSE